MYPRLARFERKVCTPKARRQLKIDVIANSTSRESLTASVDCLFPAKQFAIGTSPPVNLVRLALAELCPRVHHRIPAGRRASAPPHPSPFGHDTAWFCA